ncbi:helicase C-terminal domain-containing protein [Pseudomonas aeruginosa]
MEYLRIGALTPPQESRSQWARELLVRALEEDLEPEIVPEHQVVGFTLNAPPHLGKALRTIADRKNVSLATASAGLIQAVLKFKDPIIEKKPAVNLEAIDSRLRHVRPILHPMVEAIRENIPKGKVIFAEAATGTGKGSLIVCLALDAAQAKKRALISAPLPVIWQLTQEMAKFEDAKNIDIGVLLGRPNFVDPDALTLWANTTGSQAILDWIASGGEAATEASRNLSKMVGIDLKWLLDDALALDEDIPTSQIMLSEQGDNEDSQAEQVYRQLRDKTFTADILMCSHHFLAAHYRLTAMGCEGILPDQTDVLLVDEAHQLEDAFASVNTETLHLHALDHALSHSTVPKKTAALEAITRLAELISETSKDEEYGARSKIGELDRFGGLEDAASSLQLALEALKPKKKDAAMQKTLRHAKSVIKSVLSRQATIRVELTPVKKYAVLSVGRSNLEKPLNSLWLASKSAVLVSATLTGSMKENLMSWKLCIPDGRLMVPKPVIPSWIYKPVTLSADRVESLPNSESDQWHDELAAKLVNISDAAAGGTLVLLTSYASVEALSERMRDCLGDRLIAQSPSFASNACASAFRASKNRPVWLGVGAAWTGFNLSDSSVPAELDKMLTDLVIARLPYNTVRTLSHNRRTNLAGPVVGLQEALWRMKQGLGRLVRREGVLNRRLWVLDCRIDAPTNKTKGMRDLLANYKVEA